MDQLQEVKHTLKFSKQNPSFILFENTPFNNMIQYLMWLSNVDKSLSLNITSTNVNEGLDRNT